METRAEKIARLQSILAQPSSIAPLTANQKRGFDAARLARLDTLKELEKADKADKADKAIADKALADNAMTYQENNKSTVSSTLGNALSTAGDIVVSAGDAAAHIPTPGSIATPLIILLVFFLALIPIAGNTRLKWLWLVVTGNADMASGVASGDIKRASATTNSTNPSTSPPSFVGIIPYMSLEV